MNSERGFIESIYNEIQYMKKEQTYMKDSLTEVKTDIKWIKKSVENLDNCVLCKNSKETKKLLEETTAKTNQIYWIAAGVSAGISLIILILVFTFNLIKS